VSRISLRGVVLGLVIGVGAPIALANPHAALFPKLAKGGPKPFTPLKELTKGGKVLKATDKVKTHTGKTVSVAEYLKELNRVKKLMNAAGHSLRKGRPLVHGAVKWKKGDGSRRKAIKAAHSKPIIARRPLAERIKRFYERTAALKNGKLAKDAKFKKAFPNFTQHLVKIGHK